MYLKEHKIKTHHVRTSKLGKEHAYVRHKTIVQFKCDCCGCVFERPRSSMDPKRLSNNYFHVCSDCDAKQFAQKKGVDRKKLWDLPADADVSVSEH